jgi:hypothetical protein
MKSILATITALSLTALTSLSYAQTVDDKLDACYSADVSRTIICVAKIFVDRTPAQPSFELGGKKFLVGEGLFDRAKSEQNCRDYGPRWNMPDLADLQLISSNLTEAQFRSYSQNQANNGKCAYLSSQGQYSCWDFATTFSGNSWSDFSSICVFR